MPQAGVVKQEIDLSTRVPSFPGVFGAINFPAKKGPVNDPQLSTSDVQFLTVYTPNARVEVGYDLGYFSGLAFLQQSQTMWTNRVVGSGALWAGAVNKSQGTPGSNVGLSMGLTDPLAFVFDASDVETPAIAQIRRLTFSQVGSFYDVIGAAKAIQLYNSPAVGHYFWFNVTDGTNTQTDPVLTGTGHQVDILTADTSAQIAVKFAAVVAAVSAAFTETHATASQVLVTNVTAGADTSADSVTGTAAVLLVTVAGADEVTGNDETLLIYASSQGDWASAGSGSVLYKLTNFVTDEVKVKVPNAFVIEVFKANNLAVPVETFLCSRVLGTLDGNGNNIFVEDQLKGSNFIRATNNPGVVDTVLPLDQLTPLALTGGFDGSAVLDSDMVTGVAVFSSPSQQPVTILMDAGRATAVYGQACDALVTARGDCVAILSTPYSAEASATYLNDIITYRKMTLNLNSTYSALYTPHVKIFDKFNNRQIFVSPDGYAAAAISFSASNFEIWFPPAGFKRGLVRVLDLRRRFTDGELGLLYDNGINPFKFVPGKGIAIWGQKTLSATPSALDRLNVRLMLIVIEPAVASALENFTFEFNDTQTRNLIVAVISAYLDGIKARSGFSDYQVVCDLTNNTPSDIDSNRLNCDVYVLPEKSAEFIRLRTIITSQSLSFQQAQSIV